jgi:hypothetical protein
MRPLRRNTSLWRHNSDKYWLRRRASLVTCNLRDVDRDHVVQERLLLLPMLKAHRLKRM